MKSIALLAALLIFVACTPVEKPTDQEKSEEKQLENGNMNRSE